MRVPIEGGRGIGYILRPGFDLPPLMFSIEETEAIVLALGAPRAHRRRGAEGTRPRRVNQKIAGAVPAPLRQALGVPMRSMPGAPIAPPPCGHRPRAGAPGDPRRAQAADATTATSSAARRERTIRPLRADLLFGDGRRRRLVRTAPGAPPFPRRPRRGRDIARRSLSRRRRSAQARMDRRLDDAERRGGLSFPKQLRRSFGLPRPRPKRRPGPPTWRSR